MQATQDWTGWSHALTLTLSAGRLDAGVGLVDFPVLVSLRKQCLRALEYHGHVACNDGRDLRFADAAGTVLDFEVEVYDPRQGVLCAWVRLPLAGGGQDTLLRLYYGNPAADATARAYRVWDQFHRVVLHFNSGDSAARDSSVLRHDVAGGAMPAVAGVINSALALCADHASGGVALRAAKDLKLDRACTVSAWVRLEQPADSERLQVAVAQWGRRDPPRLRAHDAGKIADMDTTGYAGAVFDGRHVYFVPAHDRTCRHGKVLRYDSHRPFRRADAWQVHDAGRVDGLDTRGYHGAVFDGACIYFIPERDDQGVHARVLRYDTRLPFHAQDAWSAYEAGKDFGCRGGACDGRFLYLAPGEDGRGAGSGKVLRYDTRAPFKQAAAWRVFNTQSFFGAGLGGFSGAVFTGRHVFFVPFRHANLLGYDVRADYDRPESWSVFDAGEIGMGPCNGAVHDGRHIYFAPLDRRTVLRLDTRRPLTDAAAWQVRDMRDLADLRDWGFAGGFCDGRHVYFVPACAGEAAGAGFHGMLLRYDTRGDFNAAAAWQVLGGDAVDGMPTVGYQGGVHDGRYFYCVPWHDGEIFRREGRIEGHARVLRGDTAASGSVLRLSCTEQGQHGGYGGNISGPAFAVNTDAGYFRVSLARAPAPGWHHLAGVYDGAALRLFVDGRLAAEQPAHGRLSDTGVPVTLGALADGSGMLDGALDEVRICATARPEAWLRLAWENQSAPESFFTVGPEQTVS